MKEYWDRFASSFKDIQRTPLRVAALIILAIIIFSFLVALILVLTPKGSFEVECIECQGRDGNLVFISGTETFNVVVKVADKDGNAVENATVKIVGGDKTASAKTDSDGMATVQVSATLGHGEQSAFLKVIVEKSGFEKFVKSNFVTIARK